MAIKYEGGFLIDDECVGEPLKYEILDTFVEDRWTTMLVKDFWDCGTPGEYISVAVVQTTDNLEQPIIVAVVEAQLSGIPGSVAVEFPDEDLAVMGPVEFMMFNKACSIVTEYVNRNGGWDKWIEGYPEEDNI